MTRRILFFPFTYMTDGQLATASAFFPVFDFLALEREQLLPDCLNRHYKNGRISPIFPSEYEMETIEQATARYIGWADIHRGNEHNLKAILKESAYFTDDTHVTSIKSQLRGGQTAENSRDGESAWQKNLLFLKLAQLCDAQYDSIDTELARLEKNKNELVMALRGLDTPLSNDKNIRMPADFGEKMTRERIVNWAGYMLRKDQLNPTDGFPILMTTSQSIYDWFETNCDQFVNPLDIKKIKVHENKCENQKNWQHRFVELLMGAVNGRECRKEDIPYVDDSCSSTAHFKLGLFSGSNINPVFNVPDEQIPVCLLKLK